MWNKVLNLRLLWLLFSVSGSLWVAWNREHRLKNTNLWAVEVQSTSSWIWKFILSLRPLAKRFLSCKVGDGNNASFWFDNWTLHGPLINFVGPNGPRMMGMPLDSCVARAVISSRWRLPSPRTRCQPLKELRQTLLTTPIPLISQGMDRFQWGLPPNTSPRFSSKHTWEHLRHTAPIVAWDKAVWFKGGIPKFAFTFWTANLDRLPVRARLSGWGMNFSPLCCLCNLVNETRDHLFLHCEFSEQVWAESLRRLGQPMLLFHNWSALISWLSSASVGIPLNLKRMVSHAVIYLLWRERNNKHFNSASSTPDIISAQLDRSIMDLLLARRSRKGCGRLLARWFAHS
ncbi:hypothetical protein V5N11_033618 [Cardamine amara subsp. amara]|uniref:Reverse transcriptase zinc-binding domain-containing protein n=1 Tax=Cardamine amara subsp. amara TaxID=228776 RepID=A0ABD0ZRV3_CARAN